MSRGRSRYDVALGVAVQESMKAAGLHQFALADKLSVFGANLGQCLYGYATFPIDLLVDCADVLDSELGEWLEVAQIAGGASTVKEVVAAARSESANGIGAR